MKSFVLILIVLCGGGDYVTANEPQIRELELADHCNSDCKPPACRCSSVILDENIDEKDIPQFVLLTFDDAITALNYEYIDEIFSELKNPDGCDAVGTFFVSHDYTDYTKVHALWSHGHEIALHSITHNHLAAHWQNISVNELIDEFAGQRVMIAHFANIPFDDINGMRLPLLELSGNNTYEALVQCGLTWDSSWPSQHFLSPGLWPYSLDYRSIQDCPIGKCPTASIKNAWVLPLLNWVDVAGYKCSMVDGCGYLPDENDVDALVQWMIQNFEHSYRSNKAPFGVHIHAAWFLKGEQYYEAYKEFLKYLNGLPDVYFVTGSQALEFTRNPRAPGNGKPFDSCTVKNNYSCEEKVCHLTKQSTNEERWMACCASCPAVYPWLRNPLGEFQEQPLQQPQQQPQQFVESE